MTRALCRDGSGFRQPQRRRIQVSAAQRAEILRQLFSWQSKVAGYEVPVELRRYNFCAAAVTADGNPGFSVVITNRIWVATVLMRFLDQHGVRNEIAFRIGQWVDAHLANTMYTRTGAIVGMSPHIAPGKGVIKNHGKKRLEFPRGEVPYRSADDVRCSQSIPAVAMGKTIPRWIAILDIESCIENVADILTVFEHRKQALPGNGFGSFCRSRAKGHVQVKLTEHANDSK